VLRIVVHLAGETRPICHTHPTLSPHMVPDHTYLTWSTHSNLSWVTDRFGRNPLLLRKRNSQLHPQHAGWPICGSLSSFPPTLNQRTSRLKPSFCRQQATGLTRPISPAFHWYVQYLLAGANPSVLNRHRWGLWPPKGPARSLVIQSPHKTPVKWCETPIADPWFSDHSVSTEIYIYA
jgi:hypothetical protein